MEINLTPFMKIASMGAVGYACGMVLKTNPRMMATIWLVAEAVVQIFRSLSSQRSQNEENFLIFAQAVGAMAYMAYHRIMTDLFLGICAASIGLASTVLNYIFDGRASLQFRARPITGPYPMIHF